MSATIIARSAYDVVHLHALRGEIATFRSPAKWTAPWLARQGVTVCCFASAQRRRLVPSALPRTHSEGPRRALTFFDSTVAVSAACPTSASYVGADDENVPRVSPVATWHISN
jgi:hypothetical protein